MSGPTLSRQWATPVLMACFLTMGGTGLLMFFHWQSPLQKEVHEWLGWGLVTAVLLHVLSNLAAFKRHFAGQRRAAVLVGVAVLALAGTAAVRPAQPPGRSAPAVAFQALARAPLATVAPVFGLTVAEARAALLLAGVTPGDDTASLNAAAHGSREQIAKALQALAGARAGAPR